MSVGEIIELLVAIALIVGGIWLYRKRGREDPRHGSQTAILLLVIGAIMAIHATGLLEITGLGMRG
jgi:hypothetical protein